MRERRVWFVTKDDAFAAAERVVTLSVALGNGSVEALRPAQAALARLPFIAPTRHGTWTGRPATLVTFRFRGPDDGAHQQVLSDLCEALAGCRPQRMDLGVPVLVDQRILLPVGPDAACAQLREAVQTVLTRHAGVVNAPSVADQLVHELGSVVTDPTADAATVVERQRRTWDEPADCVPLRDLPLALLWIVEEWIWPDGDRDDHRVIKMPLQEPPAADDLREQVHVPGRPIALHGAIGDYGYTVTLACFVCAAQLDLVLYAHGHTSWIRCPDGHYTRDWRLTPYAVTHAALQMRDSLPTDNWLRINQSIDINGE